VGVFFRNNDLLLTLNASLSKTFYILENAKAIIKGEVLDVRLGLMSYGIGLQIISGIHNLLYSLLNKLFSNFLHILYADILWSE